MTTSIARHLLSALVLAAAAGAAHAAVDTGRHGGARDPFTEGARTGERDPFSEGARIVAGLDRSGVSAEPSRAADPYLDGARATDVFTDGALAAARG